MPVARRLADEPPVALAGPPAPIPHDVALAGSDDGAHTWSSAVSGQSGQCEPYAAPRRLHLHLQRPDGDCLPGERLSAGAGHAAAASHLDASPMMLPSLR